MENKKHNLQDKRCECCGYMTYHREHMGCILAAQKAQQAEPAHPCWSCGNPVTTGQRADADGNCPHCGAELDLEDWPPAPPPAVAVPVELRSVFDQMFDYSVDPTDDVSREWLWRFSKNLVGRLSSKSPAVVVPQKDHCRAMIAALPQGAVVVPDEMESVHDTPFMSADTEPEIAYRDGWNACRAAMLAAAPQAAGCLPAEMTPAMMRAVQMRSELGAYAAANLAGAYDLFAEFWRVAVEEVNCQFACIDV